MAPGKTLIWLLRRDLRLSDNPLLHYLTSNPDHGFSYLLPIYIIPPYQIEVSGFLEKGERSPYPPARSKVAKFWRCGPHRAKFLAQCIWDVKSNLEGLNSGLVVRIGKFDEVLREIIKAAKERQQSIGAVWMTEEKAASEEIREQESVAKVCSNYGIDFKLWLDEKYLIDDRDIQGMMDLSALPDVYTSYRKLQEPLRERPRPSLSAPTQLLPFPNWVPPQSGPFVMPDHYQTFEERLVSPVTGVLVNATPQPRNAETAHPFPGGERPAWDRLYYLVKAGCMTNYKKTRNSLLGLDYSTKLSGYLSLGCLTARQVHEEILKLEDGTDPRYQNTKGFNQGESPGTESVRMELLWRDYMRLCAMKFGDMLFQVDGFRQLEGYYRNWKSPDAKVARKNQRPSAHDALIMLYQFLEGRTGMGLIDASQRELYHTGYTSNRARQNVANFFAKHIGIDWRYGAEWYEMMLIDYDVASNWANWQYVAGVGNDPRGDGRVYNPVKQAFDYDPNGVFVRTWVAEVRDLEDLENVFQVWTTSAANQLRCNLANEIMVNRPVKRIDFLVDRKPRANRYRGGAGGGRRAGRGPNWRGPVNESSEESAEQDEYAGEQDGESSMAEAEVEAETVDQEPQEHTPPETPQQETEETPRPEKRKYPNSRLPPGMLRRKGGGDEGDSNQQSGTGSGQPSEQASDQGSDTPKAMPQPPEVRNSPEPVALEQLTPEEPKQPPTEVVVLERVPTEESRMEDSSLEMPNLEEVSSIDELPNVEIPKKETPLSEQKPPTYQSVQDQPSVLPAPHVDQPSMQQAQGSQYSLPPRPPLTHQLPPMHQQHMAQPPMPQSSMHYPQMHQTPLHQGSMHQMPMHQPQMPMHQQSMPQQAMHQGPMYPATGHPPSMHPPSTYRPPMPQPHQHFHAHPQQVHQAPMHQPPAQHPQMYQHGMPGQPMYRPPPYQQPPPWSHPPPPPPPMHHQEMYQSPPPPPPPPPPMVSHHEHPYASNGPAPRDWRGGRGRGGGNWRGSGRGGGRDRGRGGNRRGGRGGRGGGGGSRGSRASYPVSYAPAPAQPPAQPPAPSLPPPPPPQPPQQYTPVTGYPPGYPTGSQNPHMGPYA